MTLSGSRGMFCHNCGVPQSDEANFCAQCGVRQTIDEPVAVESVATAASDARAHGSQPDPRPVHPTSQPAREARSGLRAATVLLWLVTAAWVSLVSLHAYANWPRLSRLEASGWWDFLTRAIAPLVVVWLAMGYFRLAAKLRRSEALTLQTERLVGQTEKASALASELVGQTQAALETLRAELQRLGDQEKDRMRALQPRWEVSGHIAHEKVHEINLRNAGMAATGVSAAWDKKVPMAVILSEAGVVERGGHLTVKAMFLEERLDAFELKLQYCDGANQQRVADIAVSDLEVAISHAGI